MSKTFGSGNTPAGPLTGAEALSVVRDGALVDTTAQAIAALAGENERAAADVTFDNAASGLAGANVQAAIDELAAEKLDAAGVAETVRDTLGATLVAGANITITVDDAADTVTIASTASGTGPTNLEAVADATRVYVHSDTGGDATINAATVAAAGVMTAADRVRLNGLAAEIDTAVDGGIAALKAEADPFPQYTTEAEVNALISAAGGGGGGEQPAGSITDTFSTNSLADYTQFADTASDWAIANGFLTANTGVQSILARTGVSFADGEVSCILTEAQDAGLVLRLQDNANYYLAVLADGSSTSGTSNSVSVFKRIAGTFARISGPHTVSAPRGQTHTFAFSVEGSTLVAKLNGATIATVADGSITAAGLCGIRHHGGNTPGPSRFDSFTYPNLEGPDYLTKEEADALYTTPDQVEALIAASGGGALDPEAAAIASKLANGDWFSAESAAAPLAGERGTSLALIGSAASATTGVKGNGVDSPIGGAHRSTSLPFSPASASTYAAGVWIRPSSLASYPCPLALGQTTNQDGDDRIVQAFLVSDGSVLVRAGGMGTGGFVDATIPAGSVEANKLAFLQIERGSNYVRGRVGGGAWVSATIAANQAPTTDISLTLGADTNGGAINNDYSGMWDEAFVLQGTLADEEWDWLYNGGAGRAYSELSEPAPVDYLTQEEADALYQPLALTVTTKTASATLALTDGGWVEMDVATANTLTIPPNSSVAFPIGHSVNVHQRGAGQTTIAAGSGVTIRTPETLKLRKRWATAVLVKRATDEWVLSGDVEAAP